MSDYDWPTVRTEIIEQFAGQTPRAEDEATIIEIFAISPQRVLQATREIADLLAQKRIIWGWSVLRSRLERSNMALSDIIVSAKNGRQEAIALAEQWIWNAGLYLEEPGEIEDELFGDSRLNPLHTGTIEFLEQLERDTRDNPGRELYEPLLLLAIERTRENGVEDIPNSGTGLLHDYADDEPLRQRMVKLWHDEARPAGAKAEQESAAYNQKMRRQWKAKQRMREIAHRNPDVIQLRPPQGFPKPPQNE